MYQNVRISAGWLALFLLFFALPAQSQEEDWDTYTAAYKKGLSSVMVDLSLHKTAPLRGLNYVAAIGVMCKDCNSDGMPTQAELEKCYVISDTLKAKLDKLVRNRMVGTFTYRCDRLDYFYVQDTTRIRERMTTLFKVYFPTYKPYIIIREDRLWNAYKDILYPNEENAERMENQKVIMKLVQGGDNLTIERPVIHQVDFVTEKDRSCFIAYASANGYALETSVKRIENELLYKLKMIRSDLVDLESITRITLTLNREIKKCKGIYEGWEAPVVKTPVFPAPKQP
ncbi:hypothetical protein HNQ91_000103 [Filimonas zeae]|uniref:DUF695 domain-containing protein n=1 Tax=Filimonas zeae TaxID=1737353 RepID=UPI0016646FE0|nr:DUF695 domain-containing protein [Filimonas zeae]MDR6337081.1 hypothetical protein [Filimonas zeae]